MLLHDLFARAARRHPDRLAVDVPPDPTRPERRTATYRELAERAAGLSAAVGAHVTCEAVVAILLPRDVVDLFAAELAVLQAGAAWTWLDPALPDAHLEHVLADSCAAAVVTDRAGAERLDRIASAVPRVRVDLPLAFAAAPPPEVPGDLRRLAYVIYTSGTTGRPKGVQLEHGGVVHLIESDVAHFGFGPGDRIAQGSSHSYDSSVEETFAALASGATVVVMDAAAARLGPDLVGWLRRERITVLMPTPTLLRTAGCRAPRDELPDLRLVYAGGEAIPADVVSVWARDLWFENGYGPTECTVTALRGRLRPGEPVTIGRPVGELGALVLDEAGEECPDGTVGELCLQGVGLARGYLGDPERTAQAFPVHPRFGRMYCTGDLARREASGDFTCLGRVDHQVKIRGHRIELEAVEAILAEHPAVAEAGVRMQGSGAATQLVGFVVAVAGRDCDVDALRGFVAERLPAAAVPARIALLDVLPLTAGGKLDRRALPTLDAAPATGTGTGADDPPRSELERAVAAAFGVVLGVTVGSRVTGFFDLGGDSVRAAELISLLRERPETAGLAVRDLYLAPSVAGLAARADHQADRADDGAGVVAEPARSGTARPVLVTCTQAALLLVSLLGGAALAGWIAFSLFPWLVAQAWGPLALFGVALSTAVTVLVLLPPLSLAFAVLVKRLVIGCYRPLRAPAWSGFHLRHWIVQRAVGLVPWGLFQGTELQLVALRLLGARIGRGVHLHRGVDLVTGGGWDLLTLGDRVALEQDAALGVVELDRGDFVVAPITLEDGVRVGVRGGVRGGATVGAGTEVEALASVQPGSVAPGVRVDGVPAREVGSAEPPPTAPPPGGLGPGGHAIVRIGLRLAFPLLMDLPWLALLWGVARARGLTPDRALEWLYDPFATPAVTVLVVGLVLLERPLALLCAALLLRATPVPAGRHHHRSWRAALAEQRAETLEAAGNWLSGGLLWPVWLRIAGMRIGRGCEVSTILGVAPELCALGAGTFFADGIYLGAPRVRVEVFELAPLRLGARTFLGNHAVVPPGTELGDDMLLGVCTVADERVMASGGDWFGHPPFRLPRREVVEMDRRTTHEPSVLLWVNRLGWELARFGLPAVGMLVALCWFSVLDRWLDATSGALERLLAVSVASFAAALAGPAVVLALKWLLLGRVRPGRHGLWSCWCCRWDFLYVAWGRLARPTLAALEGTLLLAPYLRAMGVRIGRRVLLGRGFAQVVDPDMLVLEDGAAFDGLFQAHSFEDRVLKTDHVVVGRNATVRRGAVVLYGARIGAGAVVGSHAVVMKNERLAAGGEFGGCPCAPIR